MKAELVIIIQFINFKDDKRSFPTQSSSVVRHMKVLPLPLHHKLFHLVFMGTQVLNVEFLEVTMALKQS